MIKMSGAFYKPTHPKYATIATPHS